MRRHRLVGMVVGERLFGERAENRLRVRLLDLRWFGFRELG